MERIKVTLSLDSEAFDALNRLASERTRGQFVSGLLRSAAQPPALSEAQQAAIGAIRRLLDLVEDRTGAAADGPSPIRPHESAR